VVVVDGEHGQRGVGCCGGSDGGGRGKVRMGLSTWSTREKKRANPRGRRPIGKGGAVAGGSARTRLALVQSITGTGWWGRPNLNSFQISTKFCNLIQMHSRSPKIFKLGMMLHLNRMNNFINWVNFKFLLKFMI
jgi:hypothetical protein